MDSQNGRTRELAAVPRVDLGSLRVKVFADGASIEGIRELCRNPLIAGLTTNPTLMRKAGVTDFEAFARELLGIVSELPVSFEVFSDEPDEMLRQARKIASWGDNVYVKIPVTDTSGTFMGDVVRELVADGLKVNVTGMLTLEQVERSAEALGEEVPAYASVFAGRIADTGVDPLPIMSEALEILSSRPNIELIWASPREILNIVQADSIGCHVITVTHDLLKKLPLIGRDLAEFSLDTVKMFHGDARAAGYTL
ncbi:MAG TPA: transaldolase [Thermoleophilaceae bacterium]|nr:transaldolase [Thermoleophilaceae bacterium]